MPPEEFRDHEFSMVLTGGQNHQWIHFTLDEAYSEHQAFNVLLSGGAMTQTFDEPSRTDDPFPTRQTEITGAYDQELHSAGEILHLYVTASGCRPCLGHHTMQTNDLVAILYGRQRLVNLRKLQGLGRKHFATVGEARFYDLVEGEAAREHEEQGPRD